MRRAVGTLEQERAQGDWLAAPGYEGTYEVSRFGEVRSITRKVAHGRIHRQTFHGRVLRQRRTIHGYMAVALRNASGKTVQALVHRLVALAFLPHPDAAHLQINHIDGDKTNNSLPNLEWCTRSENMIHAYRVLGRPHSQTGRLRGLHHCAEAVIATNASTGEVRSYASISSVVDDGFRRSAVSDCLSGRKVSHYGWRWRYASPLKTAPKVYARKPRGVSL